MTLAVLVCMILLCSSVHGAPSQTIPAEGLYMVMRSDLINQIGAEISLYLADEVNQYTQTPDISGSSNGVDYTLSSFLYDIYLNKFAYSVPADQHLSITWGNFDFIIQFNYHMCLQSFPNPCESGVIQVYTTVGGGSVSLVVNAKIDLVDPTISVTADSVALNIPDNAAEVYVDCTNVICLIPTDDIANAVANAFVSSFQTAVQGAFNKVAAQYIGTVPTTLKWANIGLDWQLQTDFLETNGNIVFYAKATVVSDKNPRPPPFNPTFAPPLSVFQSPPGPLTMFYTEYAIDSAFFSLNVSGFFSRLITNSDLPPNSPYKLSTNDFYFRLFVPGLAAYPNMNITVQTTLQAYNIHITPKGITFEPLVILAFNLINSTTQHPGWVLLFDISGNMVFSTADSAPNLIQISSSFNSFSSNTTLISSAVGSVAAPSIGNLLQTLISILLKLPTENITVVNGFSVSQTAPLFNTQYGGISTQVTYAPAPSVPCADGSKCAIQNTCCKWTAGWGCCTLPGASCCQDAGCCPSGTVCDGGECYDSFTKTRVASAEQYYLKKN